MGFDLATSGFRNGRTNQTPIVANYESKQTHHYTFPIGWFAIITSCPRLGYSQLTGQLEL